MELPFAESWKIKMIEPLKKSTREQREQWLKEAHNNVFMLKAEQVYIDCLTDSGTGAMSDHQWSAMMLGDESYAGATSFYKFQEVVQRIFGFKYVIPTHQGRAAENVLFSYLVKEGNVVPGNAHFDTTKGHIEARKAKAIDVTIDEAKDTQLEIPFKGNVSLEKLEKVLVENKGNVPFMVLTVTNNTVGGQPVSMKNIKETCELCHKYGVPVVMDSARFAENSYFIKTREEGYANKTIKEIAREMYSYVDAMTMSAKKDGLVNMGGFIATNKEEWYEGAKLFCIPFEGFLTYGALTAVTLTLWQWALTRTPSLICSRHASIRCSTSPASSTSMAFLTSVQWVVTHSSLMPTRCSATFLKRSSLLRHSPASSISRQASVAARLVTSSPTATP